jgi:Protein of unknown function (DUF2958)
MKNLYDHINQSGITYGEKKLELMRKACELQAVPLSDHGPDPIAPHVPTLFVKLFDPCGSWTWYIQDWDGKDICFGWVEGFEKEWGSFSLEELSDVKGKLGIGIEIDTHFAPTPAEEIYLK